MNTALFLRLLPETLLGLSATGILGLQLLGVGHSIQRRIALTGLGLTVLVLICHLRQPPLSLCGTMFYLTSWSQCGKIILTGVAMVALGGHRSQSNRGDFFLLMTVLTGFIILSTAHLFVPLFCYLWCLMAAYCYHIEITRSDKSPIDDTWRLKELISALMLVTGGITYWAMAGTSNVFYVPPSQSQQSLWPTVFILAGMQHLVANNYFILPTGRHFSLIESVLLPLIELQICLVILLPRLNEQRLFLYSIFALYAVSAIAYANHKIRGQKAYAVLWFNSFRIQNGWLLLVMSAANHRSPALAVFHTLAYLYSSVIIIQCSEKKHLWPLRLWAWLNLAGLPLTPGFVVRWELVQMYQASGWRGVPMVIVIVILSLWTFWNYGRQLRYEFTSGLDSVPSDFTLRTTLMQLLLALPLLIMGSCWSWFIDHLETLLLTIHP